MTFRAEHYQATWHPLKQEAQGDQYLCPLNYLIQGQSLPRLHGIHSDFDSVTRTRACVAMVMPSARQTQIFFSWTSEHPWLRGIQAKEAPPPPEFDSYRIQILCTFGIWCTCPVVPHSFSTTGINMVCLISTVTKAKVLTLKQGPCYDGQQNQGLVSLPS